jgi:hypothetical protein
MTSFLLCWYACGWINCGMIFVAVRVVDFGDTVISFLFAPVVLPLLAIHFISRLFGEINPSKQYLWRKP